MAHVIETVQDDPQTSSTLEGEAAPLFKSQPLKSRPVELKRKPHPRRAFALVAAALVAAGISWWLHAWHFESTDDAQIDGHINLVSTRISGMCDISIHKLKTMSTSRQETF
jgi:membrane fusion protein, multidrug efflux system